MSSDESDLLETLTEGRRRTSSYGREESRAGRDRASYGRSSRLHQVEIVKVGGGFGRGGTARDREEGREVLVGGGRRPQERVGGGRLVLLLILGVLGKTRGVGGGGGGGGRNVQEGG